MRLCIKQLDLGSAGFKRSVQRLGPEIRAQLQQALKDLMKDPQPSRLKLEKLQGYKNPSIYTIHFTGNNSHKLSFELKSDIAVMRRAGTHKQIDRCP